MDRFLKQQEQGPRLKNPYFSNTDSQTTKKRISKRIVIVIASVLALGFLVLIPAVFQNDSYNIRLAVFSGNIRTTDQRIVSEINEYLKGNHTLFISKKNILFLATNDLADHLKNVFHFESVTIDTFAHERKIHVQVKEKPLEYIIEIEDVLRYLAPDGSILEELPRDEYEAIKEELLRIKLTQEPFVVEGVQKAQITNELLSLIKTIEANFPQLNGILVTSVEAETELSADVKIYTNQGWYVHIDRNYLFDRQMLVVQEIIRQKKDATEPILEYIDVRIPERAYVK